MTNLDSIFKSRDITLSTKVCLVKAVVFPVVMYGCESWTIRKAVTNLNSILKAETSLYQQTSVHSELWFFPVVMYGSEN